MRREAWSPRWAWITCSSCSDGDVTLVADRRDEGSIKQLVELLKKKGLEKYL